MKTNADATTNDQDMTDTIPMQIIRGIADAEGVEPENLEFIVEHHVSISAIRQLLNHESESWQLRFQIPNHSVEVTGNGAILIDGEQIRTISPVS